MMLLKYHYLLFKVDLIHDLRARHAFQLTDNRKNKKVIYIIFYLQKVNRAFSCEVCYLYIIWTSFPFLHVFIIICQFSTCNNKLTTQMFLSSYFRYKSVRINKADFSCFKLLVGGRMYATTCFSY